MKKSQRQSLESSDDTHRFSVRLRSATQEVHSMAEQTSFIRGFLRGTASHASYLRLITDLLPVYEAMEGEMERLSKTGDEAIKLFYMPEISRCPALRRDIRYLSQTYLPEGEDAPEPSLHSREYAQRIREVAESEQPLQLVGHLYTRYLGDLSGGQILARIARNSMQLNEGEGLDFYAFRRINSLADTKQRFRSALDQVGGDPQLEQLIIDEAVRSFRYNIAIFNDLPGNSLLSIWRNLTALFRRAPDPVTVAGSA